MREGLGCTLPISNVHSEARRAEGAVMNRA